MEAAVRLARFALGLALAAAPMVASAATVTVGDSTASWSSTGFTHGLGGQGTERLSWGRPHSDGGGQQSYYDFDPAAEGISAAQDKNFLLGTFTHGNFAIRAGADGAIKSAVLDFQVALSFDLGEATYEKLFDFEWLFLHNETANRANPCANGAANGVGVNVNGCADKVEFDADSDTYKFAFAEGVVTLEILGFEPGTSFWTVENQANVASLYGRFSFAPAPVPLPAAGWLLVSGLLALAVVRRRAQS
jgi:hypothetical protein